MILLALVIVAIVLKFFRLTRVHSESHMSHTKEIENIANTVQSLLSEFQADSTKSPYFESLLNILRDLQTQLSRNEEINFGKYAFAIFRIVTDDFEVERSDFGQKLLKLSTMLQKVRYPEGKNSGL
jgi:hypothetical protein